jgi:hypothetical protein
MKNKNLKGGFTRPPSDYFENLPQKLQERVEAEKVVGNKVIFMKPRRSFRGLIYRGSIAASLIALLGIGLLFTYDFDKEENHEIATIEAKDGEVLSAEVLGAYLVEHSELTVEEILENTPEGDVAIIPLDEELMLQDIALYDIPELL